MADKYPDYDLCKIETSDKKDKKYDAIFRPKGCPCSKSKPPECGKKEKVVSFGASGYKDYIEYSKEDKKLADEHKERYIARHKVNEDFNNPLTPSALSRWLLWNKRTLKASIDDFKKRFNM